MSHVAVPRIGTMTLAERDRPGAVMSRLPLVILLCALALGIIGMHGLGPDPGSGEDIGHHGAPSLALTADTAPGPDASQVALAGDEAPPADDAGLLALCLMVLATGVALGPWLLASAARRSWRLPRVLARVGTEPGTAVWLPPPYDGRPVVLRI